MARRTPISWQALDDGAGADEAQRHYANHQAEQHEAHHQVEKGVPRRLGFGQERLKVNCLYAVLKKGGFNCPWPASAVSPLTLKKYWLASGTSLNDREDVRKPLGNGPSEEA